MKIIYTFIIFILADFSYAQTVEKEFDCLNSDMEGAFEKINSAKEYKLLKNIDYKDFSKKEEYYTLKNFRFRADKILKTNENYTYVFGNKYYSSNYRIHVKTKIIGTRGIATDTYTNRNLKLKLSVIEDSKSKLKTSILKRIKKVSKKNKKKDYSAPWIIQLNKRGVFKNCGNYVFWDNYITEEETVILYWVNGKCLIIGIAPESERFTENEFRIWNRERKCTKKEYLKAITRLDYEGLFNYSQGCSFFIKGNEGGIKWKQNSCEILFECESNIDSVEILEYTKQSRS